MRTKNILIILAVIYLLLILTNIFTSFPLERGDNYFSIISAKGILKYDLRPLGDFDIFQHKSDVTLNHPPFWDYIFALILLIFSKNAALNFFNMIMILVSAFLMIKIAKIVYPKLSDSTIIILFALMLFTPLIVQASYLVDLDGILPMVMLLFVYSYLKNPNKIFLNSLLLTLIWFTKIQGIPIILVSLFLYLIFTRKKKQDYLNTVYIVLLGSGIFFVLIFAYTRLFDVSFSRIFAHSSILDMIEKQIMEYKKAILTSLWTIKQLLIWVVPSTFILYLLGVYDYFKNKRHKKYEKLMLPLLISLITLLELIPIATYGWNFPRYYVEFVPFMLLPLIFVIEEIKFEKKDIWKLAVLAGVFMVFFLIMPDPYIPEVSEAFTMKNYLQLGAKVLFNFDLLLIPLMISFLLFSRNLDKKKLYKILLISSLVIFLSVNIMQLTKPYSTNNLYGDSIPDLKNTVAYLKANMNSTDRALLFDQVGYYFGNGDNTNWYNSVLCYNSESCMLNITANGDVKFMQFYAKDLERLNGRVGEIVSQNFHLDKQFGEYLIYRRNVGE